MLALSLHQPWAEAVVLDEKSIETRSWSTAYRGRLAIHATLRRPSDDEVELHRLLSWRADADPRSLADGLPYGAVVGSVELWGVVPVEQVRDALGYGADYPAGELRWGDYSDGRFAWLLHDARVLPRPIPLRGHQRLWELPKNVETVVRNVAVSQGLLRVEQSA